MLSNPLSSFGEEVQVKETISVRITYIPVKIAYVFICSWTTTSLAQSLPYHVGRSRKNNILKGKAINPITGLDRPRGFQEVEAPRFQDSRRMKVVRLSALRTGRLYPPGNIPGTHFCWSLSRPQGHSAAGRICQWKIPVTPSGIEPATFRLVGQCHCVARAYR